MAATAEKLPPDGGKTKGKTVDITKLSSGRLHPVPDECLGHEEESVYGIPEDVRPVYKVESGYAAREEDGSGYGTPEDVRGCEDGSGYATPEDVRGYEEDESVHDKPGGADGNKPPGEEGGFAYKAKDLNECTKKPCLHGRCVNKDGGYKCTCNPGWTGQNCQQDLNECDGNPCKHGHCVNKDGGYKCTCNPGWTGQNCQQDLNECDGNPCEHGRCVNKDGGYKCTCNPGWTGQNCQQDLNECDGNPCGHGRCVNKDGGYKCTCNPGWTGQNCQQDLNECDGNPCTHGRCVNKDGGYKCNCNPGWTGQNCLQDLDECDGNPCTHGRCVNKDGGYTCTCSPGWTGQNCQQDLNECDGNPCGHGRCVNKDGGYKCTCNPGWTGQNCQQAKLCPTGWSGYENHCYKLMRDRAEWEKANLQCERLGANLASITSRDEANFINGIITGAPVGKWGVHLVWFGLHRKDGFRTFTDGSQVTYTNWQKGQPNNNRHLFSLDKPQDCVGMYSKKGSAGHFFLFSCVEKGQWNDDQCYRPYPFICKRPK
ncbi:PREDICTED: neurogenic locus Notch protein-like [Branchiostoma belcheri]|uniref:Neurogenic locus Notch protein-like n=1 Tax=Branchiostoma belcheri TaxID=7741 RepID=A0A6P5AY14_BRABE|nr:PREDICTED: neurogenic locus Notch protein-like [Branchiostoma belcheri]